mmetsp:Transcript_43443/g.87842  ORF Transcript_43443/g.87842 Transcript_43443/m.87842 type:complete len:89 (-) Transcript_43443:746-1012(-)
MFSQFSPEIACPKTLMKSAQVIAPLLSESRNLKRPTIVGMAARIHTTFCRQKRFGRGLEMERQARHDQLLGLLRIELDCLQFGRLTQL